MLWQKQWGDRGQDFAFDVDTDTQGNVALTGLFSRTIQFDDTSLTSIGSGDIFTLKLDSAGKLLWAHRLGGPSLEGGNEIATDDNDNLLVVANTYGTIEADDRRLEHQGQEDVLVAKYSSSGKLQWLQQIAGPGDERGRGIIADSAGNIFVIGEFSGTLQLGSQFLKSANKQKDIFLVKYDPNGRLLWAKRFGHQGADYGRGVGTDRAGNLYFSGVFTGKTAFDRYELTSSEGSQDIVLGKLSSEGQVLWVRSIGGPGPDEGAELEVDETGEVFLGASFAGELDLETIVLSSAGARDILAAQYNADGDLQWAKRAGGAGDDVHYAIALSPQHEITLVGTTTDGIDFGDMRLPKGEEVDSFILQIGSTGLGHKFD